MGRRREREEVGRFAAELTWSSENTGPVSAGMSSLVLEGSDWLYSANPRESPMMVSEPRVPVAGFVSGILVALVHVRPCAARRQKVCGRTGHRGTAIETGHRGTAIETGHRGTAQWPPTSSDEEVMRGNPR